MYYTAKATPVIKQGQWHDQPPTKVEHGTRLQEVLYNLANVLVEETHTPDGVPIAKWHIELGVGNDGQRAAPEAITNRLMWWQNG